MSGEARIIYPHMTECEFPSMYCPNCGLQVRLSHFRAHNCIRALSYAVNELNRRLERANQVVESELKIGTRGELACTSRGEYDIKTPMENYCLHYNKRPM